MLIFPLYPQDHANTVTVDVPAPSVACPYQALDTCSTASSTPPPTCCERVSGAIAQFAHGLPQLWLYMMTFVAWALHIL